MSSKNFSFLKGVSPNFDLFGADAEHWVHERPDLCCLRIRQLLELMVTNVAQQNRISFTHQIDLSSKISELNRKGVFTYEQKELFHTLRKKLNDAVHPATNKRFEAASFHSTAEDGLTLVWTACVRLLGKKLSNKPSRFFMPGRDAIVLDDTLSFFGQLSKLLDDAEQACEGFPRKIGKTKKLLAKFAESRNKAGWKKQQTDEERQLLDLRYDSISLAAGNHAGLQPKSIEIPESILSRSREILTRGSIAGLDEVTLFHNRWAVAQMNAFRFEQAKTQLTHFVEHREQALDANFGVLGDVAVRDYQMGALLGSYGQCFAFLAHAYEEPVELDTAISSFQRAREHFTDDIDIDRQDSYLTHAVLDKLRFGFEKSISRKYESLVDANHESIKAASKAFIHKPFGKLDRYRLALGLKIALFKGEQPAWFGGLMAAMGKALDEYPKEAGLPSNPYENIMGCMLLMAKSVPDSIEAMLKRISEDDSVRGLIASVYLMEKTYRTSGQVPEAVVEAFLSSWHNSSEFPSGWDDYDLDDRFRALCKSEGGGPLRILPFNYA